MTDPETTPSDPGRRTGRPRRSSAAVLADAAAELFLEQGYTGTTVDHIAQRAGVSRATFFNYFDAKSDVMWLELDAAVQEIPELLRASAEPSAVRAVEDALLAAARRHDPQRVPWSIAQSEVMRIGPELVASAAARIMTQHSTVAAFVAGRIGERASGLWPQTVSGAMLGAAAAAFGVWVADGVARGPLVEYVAAALTPITAGLDAR
jgi:AcrR family transcriptional regulator